MVFRACVDAETRAYVRFLLEIQGVQKLDIVRKFGISRSTVYRIMRSEKSRGKTVKKEGRSSNRTGRPRKLSLRDERLLIRKIEKLRLREGSFTIKRLMCEAGLESKMVSCQTVRRLLRRHGYKYILARRKGILTEADLIKRLKYAQSMKRDHDASIWTEKVAFYLDGASFIHKYNPADQARAPKGRIWRKAEEGLRIGCTSKGSHCGTGGRMAKFMVAISYREGVVLCEQYTHLNGQYFKDFIKKEFPKAFKKAKKGRSKLWVQDGDPSQNSALALSAWLSIGAKLLPIPPRSPDLNPIENVFKLVKSRLAKDAIENNITRENFDEFSQRVKATILNFDKNIIDKTIASMNKRIELIIEKKGGRTKY